MSTRTSARLLARCATTSSGEVAICALFDHEHLRQRRDEQPGVTKRREPDPPDAVRKLARSLGSGLERQPRLAGPARPGHGQEPHVVAHEQLHDVAELALSAEERRRRNGEVRPVEAPERWKLAVTQLEDALGGCEVLEPVLSEVVGGGRRRADAPVADGDEHLAAVTRRRDAGGAVDIRTDVAFVGEERRTRVDADANANRSRAESVHDRPGGSDRSRCGREGDEERIALRVDLDSTLPCAGLAHDSSMLRECRRVVLGP